MWSRVKGSIVFHLLIGAVVLYVLYGMSILVWQGVVVTREIGVRREKIEAIRQKKIEMRARIAELEHPEIIEYLGKERLNLKKQGEIVVVVPEVKKEPVDEENMSMLILFKKWMWGQ